MQPGQSPIDHAARLAAGQADPDALLWLQQGLAEWIREDGAMRLERCLRLPTTPARLRLLQRDFWLFEAARALECASSWHGAVQLAGELATFISRGPWRIWRNQPAPPDEASKLRRALFHVARLRGGRTLSEKQVYRIVGHVFQQKCPAPASIIAGVDGATQ
jgi:hypothetical protein